MRKPEFVRIPPPRAECAEATATCWLRQFCRWISQPPATKRGCVRDVGDVYRAHAPHFGRLMPTGNSTDNNSDVAWLVILSDWLDWPPRPEPPNCGDSSALAKKLQLCQSFSSSMTWVGQAQDHEASLSDLTQAGATILVPHSWRKRKSTRSEADPVAFAASRAAFVTPLHSAGAATRSLAHPTSPDRVQGICEGGYAVVSTDLRKLLKVSADDWRYSTRLPPMPQFLFATR